MRLETENRLLWELVESHLVLRDRDAIVSELLSGHELEWLCQREVQDYREQLREMAIAEESNFELAHTNAELEYRIKILTGTVDVPEDEDPSTGRTRVNVTIYEQDVDRDEQLKTIIEWIRDGGET